jgi:D-alanine-D-alanine ligase
VSEREGQPRRIRVMVVFGGRSAEHDVSRVTAVAVAGALDPDRYEIVPVAITTDGRWLFADAAHDAILAGPRALPAAFVVDGEPVAQLGELATAGAAGVVPTGRGVADVDVVFPLLHGPYGEDGTVQGFLELADLPYVGSGVVGSAVGMDKVMMKRAFMACNVPTPRHLAFREGGDVSRLEGRVAQELGYPCFVKPVNMGSSIGVTRAKDPAGLTAALDLALQFDEWVLVEEAITGREIEVAVLGDDPLIVSVPGEVVPSDEFYTYADKYEHGDAAELRIPAPLSDAQIAEAQDLAVRAFEACRCEAMARVDFFLDDATGRFLVNEVNTIPGFTPYSMYPRLLAASGVPYPELIDRLIELAFARHERRTRRAGRQRHAEPS